MNNKYYKVGDIIRPADGSNYRGKIIYLSKEEDLIKHQCLVTGKVYQKSYFGFFCRYCTLEEFDERESELRQEYLEEIKELESKPSLSDSEQVYLQSLKKKVSVGSSPIE